MRIFKSNITRSIFILISIAILLTTLRLVWFFYHRPSDLPEITNGVLDLREHDLTDDQILNLGEGIFYLPDVLIESTDQLQSEAGNNNNSANFGTYYLSILLADTLPEDVLLSFRVPSVYTASALFINGQLMGQSGEAADNSHDHIGKGNPYTVSFSPDQSEINIMLQVSNFDTTQDIAMRNPLKFGTLEAISTDKNFQDTLLISAVTILMLYSIFSLLIYTIARQKILLFFTVGFLFPALDELLTYDSSVMELLGLNYEWSFKFKELIYLGAAFFLVQIMIRLLRNTKKNNRFRWLDILYALSAILIIILPLNYLISVNLLFFILYFVSFIAVVPLALKEYFRFNDESLFIAVVVVGTTSGIVWGLIKALVSWEIPFYPFDYICAFIGFSFFWFKRFHRQNKQVVELVNNLEQEDKKKDEFLANTSHELNNPLHAIINIAQTILSDETEHLTNKSKENLDLLVSVGRQMAFILSDLQDFTRLREERIELDRVEVNIRSIVISIVDMFHFMIDGKNIDIIVDIPESFPKLDADTNRLTQILFNLIHNAVKYTNDGTITVSADYEGELATIYIKDTGIGMSEEVIDKVFLSYEQANSDLAAVKSGVGLGLSICKKLVELHNGEISVKSVQSKGSTFYFTLPLASSTTKKSNTLNEIVPNFKNNNLLTETDDIDLTNTNPDLPQLLIVDDDPINLKILSEMLNSEYHVTIATSGQNALKIFNNRMWDLVISDVMMPNMSGYELTKVIRKQFSVSELPILLLTSRNQSTDVYAGFLSGANDYVTKPIDALELKARVKALTDLTRSIKDQHRMEAAWLQAQIQPHFIFNTLNTIASLSDIDQTRMINLLEHFGNYLRKSFDVNTTKTLVSLDHELELIHSYLYIEKERFGDRLEIIWSIDELPSLEIPPFSIQPLVENAVQHGVLEKREGGTVNIHISKQEEYALIEISDNGVGMKQEKIDDLLSEKPNFVSGIGIINTNDRLRKLYGTGLRIQSSSTMGTKVSFIIPLMEKGK